MSSVGKCRTRVKVAVERKRGRVSKFDGFKTRNDWVEAEAMQPIENRCVEKGGVLMCNVGSPQAKWNNTKRRKSRGISKISAPHTK